MKNKEITGTVPAVDRALDILDFLTKKKYATVKELSTVLHIPSASASRLVRTLVHHEFLQEQKNAVASQYSLGLKLLLFSQVIQQQLDIVSLAHAPMERLSAETNQASQLAVFEKGKAFYVEMVLPLTPVSIVAPLHTPLALNLSAGGKVLLAGMDDKTLNTVLDNVTLTRATENSITDKHLFLHHLKIVREQGFAVDDEEFSSGIGCLAAPIFNFKGSVVAAVGVTGPIDVYKENKSFTNVKESVLRASCAISQKLGYSIS